MASRPKHRVEMLLWHADRPYLIKGKVRKLSKTKARSKYDVVFDVSLTVEVEDVSIFDGDSLEDTLRDAGVTFTPLEGRAIEF